MEFRLFDFGIFHVEEYLKPGQKPSEGQPVVWRVVQARRIPGTPPAIIGEFLVRAKDGERV